MTYFANPRFTLAALLLAFALGLAWDPMRFMGGAMFITVVGVAVFWTVGLWRTR